MCQECRDFCQTNRQTSICARVPRLLSDKQTNKRAAKDGRGLELSGLIACSCLAFVGCLHAVTIRLVNSVVGKWFKCSVGSGLYK